MKKTNKFRPNPEARLMDQAKEVLRYHHYIVSHRSFVLSIDLVVSTSLWRTNLILKGLLNY